MNPFRIQSGAIRTLHIPLKTPFITALGRKDATTNIQIRIRLNGGAEGIGEASSSIVQSYLKPARLTAQLRSMLTRFRGRDVSASEELSQDIWTRYRSVPPAAAAFECAVTDALMSELKIPLHTWLGGAGTRIETNCTLSADTPQRVSDAARNAAQDGFRTLKVKVGHGGAKADLARILAADLAGRRRGRRPRLILDGNQKLTGEGTLRLLDKARNKGARIILMEQPLPAKEIRGMSRLAQRTDIPIAADESLRSASDALMLAEENAADVFNIKIAKTGLRESLAIIAIARAAGKKLMIGCMQESARGLSPSVHLACGTGLFHFVDLDSDYLLSDQQPAGDFCRSGPWLEL